MKFTLFASFLPVLATAASMVQRSETLDSKLPVVDTSKIENLTGKLTNGQKFDVDNKDVDANARWCSHGFWCGNYSPSCCPASCCLPGTDFCGFDGNCYTWA